MSQLDFSFVGLCFLDYNSYRKNRKFDIIYTTNQIASVFLASKS